MGNIATIATSDVEQRRQQEISTGIDKFNVNPSDGIQFLMRAGHLAEDNQADIARFLRDHRHALHRTHVGAYLGADPLLERRFRVNVVDAYVNLMDFSGLEIDCAIRQFLADVALPNEAQKIDRLLEKLAERYFSIAPAGFFADSNAMFVLVYSIVLLHSDVHNARVRQDKMMTLAQFLTITRGINDTRDLPVDYMTGIYDRVRVEPLWLPEN